MTRLVNLIKDHFLIPMYVFIVWLFNLFSIFFYVLEFVMLFHLHQINT